MATKTLKPRLKIVPQPKPGYDCCWLWSGLIDTRGQGYFTMSVDKQKQQRFPAIRYSYENYIGSIPDGIEIYQTCKHPRCVNPEHLIAIPAYEHKTLMNADKHSDRITHCKRGHKLDEKNTYYPPVHWERRCRKCSALRSKAYYSKKKNHQTAGM